MKTKVELDISDSALSNATKVELKKLKKTIKALENKVSYRDQQIKQLKLKNKKLQRPSERSKEILEAVSNFMLLIQEIKDDPYDEM